jgi:hypothetical protein
LEWLCRPNVIAIEGDVLPAEWSDMREQIIAENFTLGTQFINRAPEIDGVPEDYGRDGEIEAGSFKQNLFPAIPLKFDGWGI